MRIRGRRSVAALVAAFAVALGAGTLFGYGLLAGWFEPGDITGCSVLRSSMEPTRYFSTSVSPS